MPFPHSRETIAPQQQEKLRRPLQRPRSIAREPLLPRTAADARVVQLADDLVNASELVEPDPTVDALPPSQRSLKLLRRRLESAQYLSIRYAERLLDAGIAPSVGSIGDSYDNALAETINGLYKTEVIHRRGPWRGIDDVEMATLTWVDWFNNRRLLRSIGDIPPVELEQLYYARHEASAMEAGLN